MTPGGPVVEELVGLLRALDPGGIESVALVGSGAAGGLRPDSDLDLLVLTRRSPDDAERRAVVDRLLEVSGRRATRTPGRPVELLSVCLDDVVPWRCPALADLLYGEWLRDDHTAGDLPRPSYDANLPVVVASAREHTVPLLGPHPATLLPQVPANDVRRSLRETLDPLLADLAGDERNVLLTLARTVVTLGSGRVVAKDEAGRLVAPSLPDAAREDLDTAAAAYLGEVVDVGDDPARTATTAALLAGRVR
ncbi:aminoglycoside adenylyltransferase domain-containing protein [Nocardioides sp. CFH 31398]|uniref:aminoglycoside adenylyltransferase domain-containing protein n=1 Tax=Nocardioides sp. CFH 31398 TaxID=2919579 RepID=UPI001F06381D|nr:aminoglycoside adenylyltransferase domain-containing protein [Nocardioides sp. CFH 31398]MCH1867980.1 DUF4111 domain-containing protein [Nocardioides sp. CFH 31398]